NKVKGLSSFFTKIRAVLSAENRIGSVFTETKKAAEKAARPKGSRFSRDFLAAPAVVEFFEYVETLGAFEGPLGEFKKKVAASVKKLPGLVLPPGEDEPAKFKSDEFIVEDDNPATQPDAEYLPEASQSQGPAAAESQGRPRSVSTSTLPSLSDDDDADKDKEVDEEKEDEEEEEVDDGGKGKGKAEDKKGKGAQSKKRAAEDDSDEEDEEDDEDDEDGAAAKKKSPYFNLGNY
ncbi:hypothetical protein MNV49_003537, partial [Pseudohyphozyma bogoriensis]